MSLRETACQFGNHQMLAGIISEPAGPPRRLGCVLVSAGLLPKFGPFRLYTQLARRLARQGLPTLRFDLGGIGDSPSSHSAEPLPERTRREIAAAVDHLCTTHGLDGVILGGLCSGAEDSFRYAEADPRVRAVVLIDPFCYATTDAKVRYLALRAARRALRALGVYVPRPPLKGRRAVTYHYMEQSESRRILTTLLARGVRTHFVYTGGVSDTFNHERQLAGMFPGLDFKGLVTVDLFPRTDHTQFLQQDRDQLVEAIAARVVTPRV